MMESISLLEELRSLPVDYDAAGYSHETVIAKLRRMDKDTFALEIAQAAEEVLEALFEARNVPDVLDQAHEMAFSKVSQTMTLAQHFEQVTETGGRSLDGFVSSLKGKVAELESVRQLEEMHPGYKFEIPSNPNQPVYDLIGRGPEGSEDVFVQVKAGGIGYAGDVMERMEEAPEHVQFAVSSELYERLIEVDPDSAGRLVDTGIEIGEFTEDIKSGLGTLASNSGLDVPDSIGEMLPYVGEIVLGIRLISQIVSAEGELRGEEITDRARVHGIRTLALMSRFGVTQVCAWAGGAAGTAAGSAIPGVGNVTAGVAGMIGGAGTSILLNRMLEPRMEEVVISIMGGDREEVLYLMNKSAVDTIGKSLAATSAA